MIKTTKQKAVPDHGLPEFEYCRYPETFAEHAVWGAANMTAADVPLEHDTAAGHMNAALDRLGIMPERRKAWVMDFVRAHWIALTED